MKKIKLYTVISIDGYIALPDGDLDWMTEYPHLEQLNYGYQKFLSEIDTIIMGGQTYRNFLCQDIIWPYTDKTTYIISRNPIEDKKENNIYGITGNIIEEVAKIKNGKGNDIGLLGGGELTKFFLQNNLINGMIISTVPILLGDGMLLFPPFN